MENTNNIENGKKIELKEQKALSKTILHSIVNIIVQQHNAYKPIDLLPGNLAQEISTMTLSAIDALINGGHKAVSLHTDTNGLNIYVSFDEINQIIHAIDALNNEKELLLTYLIKGASSYCLHDLFHISKIQTVSIRKQYSITATCCGRHDLEDIDKAQLRYNESKTNNLKQDLLRINEELNIPLNTVWNAVRGQHSAVKTEKRKRHAYQ